MKTFNEAIYELTDNLVEEITAYPDEDPINEIDYTLKELGREIKRDYNGSYSFYWRRLIRCACNGLMDFKKAYDIRKTLEDVADLVIKKQGDYGPNNILKSPMGVEIGLTVRIYDKCARLKNLYLNKKKPNNESIEDTWNDIMGYSYIGIMVEEGTFILQLE